MIPFNFSFPIIVNSPFSTSYAHYLLHRLVFSSTFCFKWVSFRFDAIWNLHWGLFGFFFSHRTQPVFWRSPPPLRQCYKMVMELVGALAPNGHSGFPWHPGLSSMLPYFPFCDQYTHSTLFPRSCDWAPLFFPPPFSHRSFLWQIHCRNTFFLFLPLIGPLFWKFGLLNRILFPWPVLPFLPP